MFENKDINLVLASSSPTRARLLEQTGLSFEIVPPGVDETVIKEVLKSEETEPQDIAELLAETKAVEVSKQHGSALVIGADQVLAAEGETYDKPTNKEEAYATLFKLRGRTHQLISALALVKEGEVLWRYTETAELTMRNFSPEFLGNYIAHCGDDILTSPGAYRLEAFGIHLFETIKGDYFSILGFPILALLNFLREEGHIQS